MASLFSKQHRFICDSVVYREFAYRVIAKRSQIYALVENERFFWRIDIACKGSVYPSNEDQMPPQSAPKLFVTVPLNLPSDITQLQYKSYKFRIAEKDAFPLLPSVSSAAYIGHHLSCVDHQLSFDLVADAKVHIRWKALAKEHDWEKGEEFYIDTALRFAGIRVPIIPRRPPKDLDATISPWFDCRDFQPPKREIDHVWFHYRTNRRKLE